MKKCSLLRRLNYLSLNSGFSLIELIIVVAIVALLATLVSINFSFFNSAFIKSEVQKLHTVCHYLRRKAMTTNQSQKIIFDINNNVYSYNDNQEKLAQSVCFGFLLGTKGPPSAPIHAIKKPVTFKNNEIIFYPTGIVSSGTVYLTDKNKRYQYALSAPIAPISYLRMYKCDKRWKLTL